MPTPPPREMMNSLARIITRINDIRTDLAGFRQAAANNQDAVDFADSAEADICALAERLGPLSTMLFTRTGPA